MGRVGGHHRKKQHTGKGQHTMEKPIASRLSLAIHPGGAAVALAVGPTLRLFDARSQQHRVLIQPSEDGTQTVPCIRGVAFDAAGRYLLAASEDKAAGLRVWDCSSWELIQTVKVPKKVTNAAFTPDGKHVLAADRFGDVLIATTERSRDQPEGQQPEPEVLLGHYCAILTSLAVSGDGSLLATTDRDHRVRVSVMPTDPMAGAHEIQSFCLGHTADITCSTFVRQSGKELLVTGGADGSLRLWDPLNGSLLHSLQLPPGLDGTARDATQQGQVLTEGSGVGGEATALSCTVGAGTSVEGDLEAGSACSPNNGNRYGYPVPLALVASPDNSWLVVAVNGQDELGLVSLDWEQQQLQECSWTAMTNLHLPSRLVFNGSGRLWMAAGVAGNPDAASLGCGSILQNAASEQHTALAAAPLPHWLPAQAAQELGGRTATDAIFAPTAGCK